MNLDEMKVKRDEYDAKLREALTELERVRQVALRLQGARAALDEMIAAEEAEEA